MLPARKRVEDANGNITYEPAWGDGEDPGINGVKVELLTKDGLPANMNGDAVSEEPFEQDGTLYYYVLNEDGSHSTDAAGYEMTTTYGPCVTYTQSDYYGNRGYYIFPNLNRDATYKLRFTIPEKYEHYGLTTQEIGPSGRETPIDVTTEGKHLVFTTRNEVEVREDDDPDDECVSYDIGIGLPVRYGGITWKDENITNPDDPDEQDLETNADGIFNNSEFSIYPPYDNNPDNNEVFVSPNGTDETNLDAVTIMAYEKGTPLQDDGTYGTPALDMRGQPLIAKSWTRSEILDLAWEEMTEAGVTDVKTN
jgi:hypothetical protein